MSTWPPEIIEDVLELEAAKAGAVTPSPSSWASFIRRVDMAAELAKPEVPIQYRVEGLARDGALTLIAGQGGAGKSWAGMQLCAAVQSGDSWSLGMSVKQGKAVYVDAEMGVGQTVQRFRDAGFAADAFEYIDATGLNLSDRRAVAELQATLASIGADFVVLDSLRRLSPGSKENDSDDMAPLVGALAMMTRELNTAGVMFHHSGRDGHFLRGSTAIGDQADAVFGYTVQGDARCLTCDQSRGGKFRFGKEPEDRYFRLAIGETPGLVVVPTSRPPTATTNSTSTRLTAVEELRPLCLEAVAAGHVRKAAIADAVGRDAANKSVKKALQQLVYDGELTYSREDGYALAVREKEGGGGDGGPWTPTATTTLPWDTDAAGEVA